MLLGAINCQAYKALSSLYFQAEADLRRRANHFSSSIEEASGNTLENLAEIGQVLSEVYAAVTKADITRPQGTNDNPIQALPFFGHSVSPQWLDLIPTPPVTFWPDVIKNPDWFVCWGCSRIRIKYLVSVLGIDADEDKAAGNLALSILARQYSDYLVVRKGFQAEKSRFEQQKPRST